MARSQGNSTVRSQVTPANEADEPSIRRRGHPDRHDPWFLADDDDMAESAPHDRAKQVFKDVIETRDASAAQDSAVYANMAWRWDVDHRSRGVDPDVMLVRPAPPNRDRIRSLRAWAPGHHAPLLALEVVSHETRLKDYDETQERYRLAGVRELIVFDPEREGPRREGGPFLLQVWRRTRDGRFVRHYVGAGPCKSAVLKAWLVPVGLVLRVADDPEGKRLWPTRAEVERERAEAERSEKLVALLRAGTERQRAEAERERAEAERERAEAERERAEAERAGAMRMLTRHIERRLTRELTEAERVGLRRRLEAADAEALDAQVDALADDALGEWLLA